VLWRVASTGSAPPAAGGGCDARDGEVDQRLALGGPVDRGTGASQRPGPDGQRRGAAFLVELELQPNLIEHT
jgi:hypothetical protein